MKRMRLQSLLFDHPLLPQAQVTRDGIVPRLPAASSLRRLDKAGRMILAARLLAVTALLGEFDLWPTLRALRETRVSTGEAGLGAVLGGFPTSLSVLQQRLGGGESALRRTRDGALETIRTVTGLPESLFQTAAEKDWLNFEQPLGNLLDRLPRPLDRRTARSLWAVRLDLPELPETGEVRYWAIPDLDMARRIGVATVERMRRDGERVLWQELRTGPHLDCLVDQLGDAENLVVAGAANARDLLDIERWVQEGRLNRAVVFGRFPLGWTPPQPKVLDDGHPERYLALVGISADRARVEIERRRGRFDPFIAGDREALTEAASRGFRTASRRPRRTAVEQSLVARVLRLAPAGVPETFALDKSGLAADAFARRAQALGAVRTEGRWRLVSAGVLSRDPLHAEFAKLLGPESPTRWVHEVLGGGDGEELRRWARERLDGLQQNEVRELLAAVDPAVLPAELVELWLEAALADLDLTVASRLLAALPKGDRDPWQTWLATIDRPPGFSIVPPTEDWLAAAPRAAAEIALRALEVSRRRGDADERSASEMLRRCIPRLAGLLRRRFEIELALAGNPLLLSDRGWRKDIVQDAEVLAGVLLRRAAVLMMRDGRRRIARRLLERLARRQAQPGMAGLLELDLGGLALERGEPAAADDHHFRAFRYLTAAGFKYRTRIVLFNLAVSDLDQLKLKRARERFLRAGEEDDPAREAELVRLALAEGREDAFREGLSRLPSGQDADRAGIGEAVRLLHGVEQLLSGDLGSARELLAGGGQEGEVWSDLLNALEGQGEGETAGDDGWGVRRCAAMVRARRRGVGARLADSGLTRPPSVAEAFAVALLERLIGRQDSVDAGWRGEAADLLEAEGLEGWSRRLRGQTRARDGSLRALRRVAEEETLSCLTDAEAKDLLREVGLTGLEIRMRRDGRTLTSIGSGAAASPLDRGQISLVPLGGEPVENELWRLLSALLFLLEATPSAEASSADVGVTGLYGDSEVMHRLRQDLARLAPSRLPVALFGETGVGKEVAARALHRLSGRRGRFVAVNMAALPPHLVESELFGSVRGAFTGADRSRRGLAVTADGGTLFLDEIGDLDLALQAKLLRFLESGEVRAVGADQAAAVDVRIVTATHQNLEKRMREGGFRSDLFYRISSATITIPPLRERREDIPQLRELFERMAVTREGISAARWSSQAKDLLLRHDWPGNVRELRHVVEVAMVRAGGGTVRPEHLPGFSGEAADVPKATYEEALTSFRRRFLGAALKRHDGNRSATARALGISRQTLLYHIRALGLKGNV